MRRTIGLALPLILPALLIAAEYQMKKVQVLPIESYPARTTLAGILVAADPYSTDEKSFTAFDVRDMNSRGYFPVHIIIQNTSDSFVSVRTRNVVLVTITGQELYTNSAATVVDDLFRGRLSTAMKPGTPLFDFTEKELTNRQIASGKMANGFIFFFSPEPKKNLFLGSTLRIPQITDEDNRKPIGPFLIPLDLASKTEAKP